MLRTNRQRHRRANRARPHVEALETRLAPATLVNATTVTYQDVDGDDVTVHVSKPVFVATTINQVLTFDTGSVNGSNGTAQQLEEIDLTKLATPTAAAGASLTITAVRDRTNGGDGFVNVGFISAGVDLAAVTVKGDLGRIDAGDSNTATAGLGVLNVQSLGLYGTTTQALLATPNLVSQIVGPLPTLSVRTDIVGASVEVSGGTTAASGRIGIATVGGSLRGGNGQADAGLIKTSGAIASLTIGGSIVGGAGADSGEVECGGALGSVHVGGSVIGSGGNDSGEIDSAGNMGPVTVVGNVAGGGGTNSGSVLSGGSLASATVDGSLLGGGGTLSGVIQSQTALGSIHIGGDIIGGTTQSSGEISQSGAPAGETPPSIFVGGSLVGTSADFTGGISVGPLGLVTIRNALVGGAGDHSGFIHSVGNIAGVTIGHVVLGGGGSDSGEILATGRLGLVSVGSDVTGGAGFDSGFINGTNLAGVTIGGSLVGGAGNVSGAVVAGGSLGPVAIGVDVVGGSANTAGVVRAAGNIVSVTVGGSLVGGTGNASGTGEILSSQSLGPVVIGGNLVGGSITGTGVVRLAQSGYIEGDHIVSVTVRGSVFSGSNTDTAVGSSLSASGSIRAVHDIGSITVTGSLIGNSTNPVVISATGQAVVSPLAKTNVAIGSLTVGGRVQQANILAGYSTNTNGVADGTTAITDAVNGEASIGTVRVGGNWEQSNLVAGAQPGASNQFGNPDNTEIGAADTPEDLIARIASVLIGGQVLGTPVSVSATDHYGFVAEDIGVFTLGGTVMPLKAGPSNDTLAVGSTGDVTLLEVL